MLASEFVEESADDHCRLRDRVLAADSALPPPALPFPARAAGFLDTAAPRALSALSTAGLALVQLDEPLTDREFTRFGALLGEAIPETAPAVRRYVDDGVILNLRADAGHTRDVSLQPFASTELSLHSEGSGRALADQPRYIALMCVEPGAGTGAATVLVPMAEVSAALSADDDRLLRATRYADAPGVPAVARTQEGRTVYSFRDFQGAALRWTCEAEGARPDRVNAALRRLLAHMYTPSHARGVCWTRGLLVVIDNTWFFHGRSAARPRQAGRPRHLKRLRVRAR